MAAARAYSPTMTSWPAKALVISCLKCLGEVATSMLEGASPSCHRLSFSSSSLAWRSSSCRLQRAGEPCDSGSVARPRRRPRVRLSSRPPAHRARPGCGIVGRILLASRTVCTVLVACPAAAGLAEGTEDASR